MLNKIKDKINTSEFLRIYILGFFNLLFSLLMLNQFQYVVFANIDLKFRTDLSVTSSFLIGVSLSYFLTRKYVFRFENIKGSFSMYIKFVSTNLLNYFVPLFVWFIIEIFYQNYSVVFFNIINFVIANILFPVKFLIYKYRIFE